MRKPMIALALVAFIAMASPAVGEICAIDRVPAATLLLPYFEVDLNNPLQMTTLFSIHNASADSTLAHVTLWTDLSIPTLDFDVFLTGYDVVTINLRDIFINGQLPATGTAALSPVGDFSTGDPTVGDLNCGKLPLSNLTGGFISHLQAAHTGGSSSVLGGCVGLPHGDNIARGYITVDVATECSLLFPSSPGYFTGVAGFDNILWGDYFFVNEEENFAQGDALVHIEACNPGDQTGPFVGESVDADGTIEPFCFDGEPSFYERYNLVAGEDFREPLASTWATRYVEVDDVGASTDLIVWRDPGEVDLTPSASCFTDWYPMNQRQVVAFDEEENPTVLCEGEDQISPPQGADQVCFPAETQRVTVCGPDTPPVPAGSGTPNNVCPADPSGWLYLNLNTTATDLNQAFVSTIISADGRFSVGYEAIHLDSLCTAEPGGVLLSD